LLPENPRGAVAHRPQASGIALLDIGERQVLLTRFHADLGNADPGQTSGDDFARQRRLQENGEFTPMLFLRGFPIKGMAALEGIQVAAGQGKDILVADPQDIKPLAGEVGGVFEADNTSLRNIPQGFEYASAL